MRTRCAAGTDRDTERRSGLSDPRPPVADGPETPSQPSSSVADAERRGPGAWVAPPTLSAIGRAPLVVADHADDGARLLGALVAQLVGLEVSEADRVPGAKAVLAEADAEVSSPASTRKRSRPG